MADFAYRPGTSPSAGAAGGSGDGAGGGGGGAPSGQPVSPTGRAFAQRFPVYQIDFTSVASGKKIAGTKRRIRWRFGFPNREALDAGETGTSCRGEEHDVTIVWSITSGKRLILADGQEVHYSMARGAKMEFSWTMRGNHVLKVVANATSQMSQTPGFRQYDLFIDGQSFFTMPKVYELGLKGPIASEARAPGVINRADRSGRALPPSSSYGPSPADGVPRSREEEEIELAKAISASLEESRQHLKKTVESHRAQDPSPALPAPSPAAPSGGGDLLDFGAPEPAPVAPPVPAAPALPPSTSYAPAPPQPQQTFPPPTPSYDASFSAPPPAQPGAMVPVAPQPGAPYGGYGGAPVPPATQYGAAPSVPVQQQPTYAAPVDQFAPQTTDDPFAPKAPAQPTFTDVTSSILGQYGGPSPAPAVGTAATGGQPAYVDQQQYQENAQAPLGPAVAEQQHNGTNGTTAVPETQFAKLGVTVPPEADDEDGVSSAMKKLINLDDISSPVDAPLTMNPFGEDEKDKKKNKTKAIPPVSAKYGHQSSSLAEIQTIKASASGEKKLVMNSPQTFDASAGTLVVSGVQSGGYSVPPPINQATGFGAGAMMNGGGYGGVPGMAPLPAQQQQPPLMQQGYGAPPPMQPQQPMYGAPPQQQAGYGAPPPMQQQPMQQPMYGGQQPPPPPQQPGGYSNYNY